MAPTERSADPAGATPDAGTGRKQREYGHSSGDRNTRTDEHDWKHFQDGKERTVHAEPDDAARERPDRHG